MKSYFSMVFIIALFYSNLGVAQGGPCQNSPDGDVLVTNGQIICQLRINEQTPSSDELSQFIQAVKVEAAINYSMMDVLSQLKADPNQITLPHPQALVVKLLMNNQELPISLNVQPFYKLKNGNNSICQMEIVDFEPRVTNLTSAYLPPFLETGLQDYINKDPRIRSVAIEQGQKVLPKIRSRFHCQ